MNEKTIGLMIKKRRKVLNVSQNDLCEMAGISQHTLSSIENGSGNPTIATLLKIANILGLEIYAVVRKLP